MVYYHTYILNIDCCISLNPAVPATPKFITILCAVVVPVCTILFSLLLANN